MRQVIADEVEQALANGGTVLIVARTGECVRYDARGSSHTAARPLEPYVSDVGPNIRVTVENTPCTT